MHLTRLRNQLLPQSMKSAVAAVMPPLFAIPLRNRFGGERDAEIQFLDQYVIQGSRVIDVGAHIGVYTYLLSKLVGRSGEVIAIEPQLAAIRYMQSGFRFRRNIKVIRAAASNKTESIYFRELSSKTKLPNAGAHVLSKPDYDGKLVPAIKLDDLRLGNVTFIKIDTEGHELECLLGAQELIKSNSPSILIEVFSNCTVTHSESIWSLFHSFGGYKCYVVNRLGILDSFKANQYLGLVPGREADRSYNFLFTRL